MSYRSLAQCVEDLRRHGQLADIKTEVNPYLEAAALQRRVYTWGGPALLFHNLSNCRFPAVSNLFGTDERCRFIFRKQHHRVARAIELKANPKSALLRPWRYLSAPLTGLFSLPKHVASGPVLYGTTTLTDLPQIVSWPMDGGPFITLPQVYSESVAKPGVMGSNIGMYRVQLAGNNYEENREVGIHYQIHRGIGIHHSEAIAQGKPLKVSIFVGGPPAHTVAAVMPLPENLSEVLFAGMLAGRRMRFATVNGHRIAVDSDFVITGTIDPSKTKAEGPFGDHLGYYSLQHQFPYLTVDQIYFRKDAIWPFTVVGRPPQEDSSFGHLIHSLTVPMVPVSLPGVKALHAVDVAGVHPLLLAIGSERYVPYASKRKPQELLTLSNAILGFNQCSLAKFLFIVATEDDPNLDIKNLPAYFQHVLSRVDWQRDLHFQTRTTMDTLDYSGTDINEGSKVVVAAAGQPKRKLRSETPDLKLVSGFHTPRAVIPGLCAIAGPKYGAEPDLTGFANNLIIDANEFPLVIIVDEIEEATRDFASLLWVCFTRANPAADIYGVGAFTDHKHWGCTGSLIIDARIKPHHAPPLREDPAVERRVDQIIAATPELVKYMPH